jgi:hypothetical protein
MAARRLSVRKIREVLRLGAEGLSDREIGRSLRIGKNTVRRYRTRAEAAGVGWPLPPELTESELENRLFPGAPRPSTAPRAMPDWSYVHRELRRPGVTLQLLWLEYKEAHPDGYQYSQFCVRFREWKGALDLVLRQEHRADRGHISSLCRVALGNAAFSNRSGCSPPNPKARGESGAAGDPRRQMGSSVRAALSLEGKKGSRSPITRSGHPPPESEPTTQDRPVSLWRRGWSGRRGRSDRGRLPSRG